MSTARKSKVAPFSSNANKNMFERKRKAPESNNRLTLPIEGRIFEIIPINPRVDTKESLD
jgi:hypothetical protein